jgi:hypothetical protein
MIWPLLTLVSLQVPLLVSVVPFVSPTAPAPGLFRSKEVSRDLACERLSAEAGNKRLPGQVAAPRPRGDYIERNIVVCQQRLMRQGLRRSGDEAILSTLQARVTNLANAAASRRPDLADRTWLVEAHYGDPQIASKIRFATQNALAADGVRVSDRTPALSVGDVDVLTRMPPSESYAVACQRYAANGSLGEGDALLAIIHRDPRATILHAGICVSGEWGWLQ